MSPTLSQIAIYPIKSLAGMLVERAQITTGGALAFDRRWAIVDASGKVVNVKRTDKIHQLRSRFDFAGNGAAQILMTIGTAANLSERTFDLSSQVAASAIWLSEFFGFAVNLIEDPVHGFPDDRAAFGPTITSTATLATVCTWFPAIDLAEARRRFRTNLELSGVPAFWEDRLFAARGEVVPFQLRAVAFHGVNPCQRCSVPTRDALTGEALPKFQQTLSQLRRESLPADVDRRWFDHFYRLGINTQIMPNQGGEFLAIGDLMVVDRQESGII